MAKHRNNLPHGHNPPGDRDWGGGRWRRSGRGSLGPGQSPGIAAKRGSGWPRPGRPRHIPYRPSACAPSRVARRYDGRHALWALRAGRCRPRPGIADEPAVPVRRRALPVPARHRLKRHVDSVGRIQPGDGPGGQRQRARGGGADPPEQRPLRDPRAHRLHRPAHIRILARGERPRGPVAHPTRPPPVLHSRGHRHPAFPHGLSRQNGHPQW